MVFHRSLTRELTFTAVGVFVVLLAILLTTQTINLLGRAAEGRIANEAVAALIGFWSLGLFPLLLILTVFISTLVVLTRVWRDHEMTVWLSSGIGLKDWIWPLMRFALPFVLIIATLTLYISPWAAYRSKEYAEVLKQREEISAISPGVFKESGAANRVYFIEQYSAVHGTANHVFMQEISDGKVGTILARAGKVISNAYGERVLELTDGRRYVGVPGRADFEEAHFERYRVVLGEAPPMIGQITNIQTRPTAALWASDEPSDKAELAWRLSLPLTCALLALLALPLSYFNPRSGHTYNLVYALIAFLLYQNALTLMRNWIGDGKVPWGAVVVVHLALFAVSLGLLWLRSLPAAPLSRTLVTLFKKA
ncbi:LPS export ABC transporter permease LptF [Crenobacter cavernae]|uniref:Lipopolysaccharide export system permease protein LptF n=1 Tax=Crenobacter cavernae TaxID=2290923 RepID=A0A345Y7V4_9NEIS|nr:LPS export ABC transporter permease LptF [Crenobacter cavernae]AXK40006.1 LPS export ABC transporter permease LptF [Crenobacter cavernae]